MKAAEVKVVERDLRIVSGVDQVNVPLLQDPRFVSENVTPEHTLTHRAYVIIARFHFSDPEILLKSVGIDDNGKSLLELPGGLIENPIDALSEVCRIVKGQVGSKITELQKFGPALHSQENANSKMINSAQLYLAEASPKSCGGLFEFGSQGLTWASLSELKKMEVIELPKNLDPTKAGRMGIMILAGLDYVKGLVSPK